MSTKPFIEKAIRVHGATYDYSSSIYTTAATPLTIICHEHGEFLQRPDVHIGRKSGCPACSYVSRAASRRSTTEWLSFEEARGIVHNQRFATIVEWNSWCKMGRPQNLPACPKVTYKSSWKGWGDWLGNNTEWLPYHEARRLVHTYNLRSYEDWAFFCNVLHRKPEGIPFEPKKIYKNEWKSWGDWLGYRSRANGNLPGQIYVLRHPDLPSNVLKVGRTYRLEKRLYEHNRTSAVTMEVLSTFDVDNMSESETKAHEVVLTHGSRFKYRNHKEYFCVRDVDETMEALRSLFGSASI